jgi:threonine dehydrogenase-like Zn-dependent dehydrogenase
VSEHEVVITGHERAELRTLRATEPQPGGELGEFEIDGHAVCSAVSPGTEINWAFAPTADPKHAPAYPGYAMVFRVERVGSGVKKVKAGDLAYCSGNHRSFVRQQEAHVLRVPDGLAPETAVFTRLMGVSMSTVTTTTSRPPGVVAVTGLGIVGNLAAQIFNACGYRVLACDPVAARRGLLDGLGITTLAALPVESAEYKERVEMVVDCSGHEAAVLDACKLVRRRGEVVLLGVPWTPRTSLSAHAILTTIFHRFVVLRSGWEWELAMTPTEFRTGSIVANLECGLDWLKKERIRVGHLYEKASPADAQTVYSNLMSQKSSALTYVFDWSRGKP